MGHSNKRLGEAKVAHVKEVECMTYSIETIKTEDDVKRALMQFSGPLLGILKAELAAGNGVDTCTANYPQEGCVFVVLCQIFLTPIQRGYEGVEFENTNDPHYWKACYIDHTRNLYIACPFNGANFKPL